MNAYVLSQVAICQSHIKGQRKQALQSINAAIGAEPDNGLYYGLRAIILCQLNRPQEALNSAQEAVAIQPDHPFSRAAEAQAYIGMNRWADAEASAREALSLDPDHDLASNQLIQALYEQHQRVENRDRVLALLEDNPEDPHTHYNAGYSYLQSGEHTRSLEHFSECLRLDPTFESARIGILEALRAQYAIYRWYLRLYFAVDARAKRFKHAGWLLPLAVPFIIVLSLLHAVASFWLLFDRRGRMAMDMNDKVNGILGGGGILLGAALTGLGFVTTTPFLLKLGVTLALTTLIIAYELAEEIPNRLRM